MANAKSKRPNATHAVNLTEEEYAVIQAIQRCPETFRAKTCLSIAEFVLCFTAGVESEAERG